MDSWVSSSWEMEEKVKMEEEVTTMKEEKED